MMKWKIWLFNKFYKVIFFFQIHTLKIHSAFMFQRKQGLMAYQRMLNFKITDSSKQKFGLNQFAWTQMPHLNHHNIQSI